MSGWIRNFLGGGSRFASPDRPRDLGLNSIALWSLLPSFITSFETCPDFHFVNFYSVTLDKKFGRKLGSKLSKRNRIEAQGLGG